MGKREEERQSLSEGRRQQDGQEMNARKEKKRGNKGGEKPRCTGPSSQRKNQRSHRRDSC